MIIKKLYENSVELSEIENQLTVTQEQNCACNLHQERADLLNVLRHRRNAASHLDFHFAEDPDWMLIHDLRLDSHVGSMTFGHLLIGRELDIYLLNTDYYNADIDINNRGRFVYRRNSKISNLSMSMKATREAAKFLEHYLHSNELLPFRFGMPIKPEIRCIILVSAVSNIVLQDWEMAAECEVLQVDQFAASCANHTNDDPKLNYLSHFRRVSQEQLMGLAQSLAEHHNPVDSEPMSDSGSGRQITGEVYCACCEQNMISLSGQSGYDFGRLFAGKAYCPECQKKIIFQSGHASV